MNHESIIDKINNLSLKELTEKSFRLFPINHTDINVFYGIDFNKNIVFAIESTTSKIAPIEQKTRKLKFSFNILCTVHIESNETDKYLHILTCYSKTKEDIEAFIRLTDSFIQSYKESKYTISNLFTSLSGLFASEKSLINLKQIRGFYAELYAIQYFHENGIDISPYWQKKEKLNFDFSISPKKRLEVKSTISESRIHHFLHEQLIGDVYDIYIVSILLRNDDKGLSLQTLIENIREIAKDDFDTLLYIDKFVRNIQEDNDLSLIKYDEEYTNNNIKFFNVKVVPKFEVEQPEGVTHTEYNSDLTNIVSTPFEVVKEWIRD